MRGWAWFFTILAGFGAAIEHLRTAVGLDPTDAGSYVNLTLCHGRLAEHQEALAAARRGIEIDPSDAELHSGLIALMNYTTAADRRRCSGRAWLRRRVMLGWPIHFQLQHELEPDRALRIG